jgi:hypothetical protein
MAAFPPDLRDHLKVASLAPRIAIDGDAVKRGAQTNSRQRLPASPQRRSCRCFSGDSTP